MPDGHTTVIQAQLMEPTEPKGRSLKWTRDPFRPQGIAYPREVAVSNGVESATQA